MPKAPHERSKKKLILLIAASVVVILGVAIITIDALNIFVPKKPAATKSADAPLVDVAAPQELINKYVSKKIESRDSLYTKRVLPQSTQMTEPQLKNLAVSQGPTNSIITYAKKDSFTVQVSSSDYVQYERKDTTVSTNDSTLISDTEAFLIDAGLVKLQTTSLSDGSSRVIYDSKNVICEIDDMVSFNRQASTYGIACIFKKVIDAQYTFVNSLVESIPNMDKATISSAITSVPIYEGSNRLVTLTLTQSDKAKLFYFATLTSDWEYIGQRPVTNPDDGDSFKLPDDLKKAISDPKWNGFLAKYII